MNPSIVNSAEKILRQFADARDLGSPSKLLTCDNPLGIGVEWPGEIRNAVAFRGIDALENYAEVKRRVEEWIAA